MAIANSLRQTRVHTLKENRYERSYLVQDPQARRRLPMFSRMTGVFQEAKLLLVLFNVPVRSSLGFPRPSPAARNAALLPWVMQKKTEL